ncbi:ribulose-phosphate 3-epimerase [Alkalitalea saponilacus]|uniref:Ribulose-phosphate 3-epimerase n=1 Tax=Alkalitalea saponilacus TaxID=889453 RepID=A0A1T5HSA8_9BACT|nr:ribulose-phosphate 3-epimerase [Alkalitalea saponilacus]ASB48332.1 ribulose-phosphate 3-epimerase [Alkalitalea saponilacus]SKC23555.1 ribulose-phosphate 3-epimerase [Alkalitalea saponilacus]
MQRLVAPSLLAADFTNLKRDIEIINNSEADWLHMDIMDGVFVPNISFGIPVVEAVHSISEKPLDVHLMIVQPERYIETFKNAGAHLLNVHYEACSHLHRTIESIHNSGMKAGVTLNPHTPVQLLEEIITDLDLVLIMSVNPGFGGQKFIPGSFEKIRKLKELILKKNSKALIEVDGGVDDTNAKALAEAGVDVFVAGSYVFKSENPAEAIRKIKYPV